MMQRRVRLGMLTPSSNTVVEPVTSAMVADLRGVTAHFGRFKVTEIALSAEARGQFEIEPILQAAALLADAKVDVIAWNGTSAGWLGFEADRRLCERITAATGIPATSSVLALVEIFERTGVERFGLVTPYTDDVQAKTVANFGASGFACAAERHLGIRVNYDFSEVTAEQITAMTRAVAAAGKPQAITTFCTNLWAAPLVDQLEREIGIPIYDTLATAVWKSLAIAGVDATQLKGWGRLFALPAAA